MFLFDEPLSNLDAKLRVQMRSEIKQLHQRLKNTVVYVTHDQVEAMTLADRVVVMHQGRVEQPGAAARALRAAGQHLRRGLHRGAVDELHRRHGRIATNGPPVAVAGDGTNLPLPADAAGRAKRPKSSTASDPSICTLREAGGGLPAEVVVVEPTGAETLLVTRRRRASSARPCSASGTGSMPGERIGLEPQLDQVHVFDRAPVGDCRLTASSSDHPVKFVSFLTFARLHPTVALALPRFGRELGAADGAGRGSTRGGAGAADGR